MDGSREASCGAGRVTPRKDSTPISDTIKIRGGEISLRPRIGRCTCVAPNINLHQEEKKRLLRGKLGVGRNVSKTSWGHATRTGPKVLSPYRKA